MQVAVGYRQRNDGFGLLPNNDLRDFESHTRSVPILLSYHREDECDKLCYFEHDNHPFLRSIKAADNAEVNAVGGETVFTCSQRSAGRALHRP